MQSNQFLYGVDVDVDEIPAEVILSRVTPLRDHLVELNKIPFAERTYDDIKQINEVAKAIRFWNDINSR